MDPDAVRIALAELRELADQHDRPAWLGPIEVTIMVPAEDLDANIARRYEDLGVDRLVLSCGIDVATGRASDNRRRPILEAIDRAAARLAPWLATTG